MRLPGNEHVRDVDEKQTQPARNGHLETTSVWCHTLRGPRTLTDTHDRPDRV